MRIAVLADIHSNLAALEAVSLQVDRIKPDRVIVAGDVINRGPLPLACLTHVTGRKTRDGWHVLKGNHEEFVLRESSGVDERPAWEREVCRHTRWTYTKLQSCLDEVKSWEDEIEIAGPAGSLFRCVHASMRNNRRGLYDHMQDHEMHPLIHPSPDVLCVGHTHIPFVRRLGTTLVVNAGAVGLPFDGDPRAAFAFIEWKSGEWRAQIIRVAYDREQTERAYHESGYFDEGGVMVPLILEELRHARPRLGEWHRTYERRVASGELSLQESVRCMMEGSETATHPVT